ncbi:MAG: glycosyltransferase family 2 protein [Ignavibacteria bacterium]|nr:glycosyltransferase family 2 protein [Ignavibacteria bacterium]MDP3830601.1 glycosyltransferase family 2 protein [Ignavibacteriaceae bacterium]
MKHSFLIILVNHNNWQDTIECINSMLQHRIEFENIIVIENGSTDNSLQLLKENFPDLNLFDTKSNLGFSGANNVGLQFAINGGLEYAILLNNDTIIESNSIDTLIGAMNKYQDVSIGTGQIRYYPDINKIWYAGGKLIPSRGLAVHNNLNREVSSVKNTNTPELVTFISGCFMCIRVSDLSKLGMLNEKFFLYLEDIEYCARAVKNGLKLLYVPNSIIYHKWHGERKLKTQTLYYAVRNRKLLIELCFPKIALIYFNVVLSIKILYWFLTDKTLLNSAIKGLTDYKNDVFGPYRN